MRNSQKLEGWLKGCLSRGGRLTLIQSVLECIPIYYLSLFKIPSCVAYNIEKFLGDFFWDEYGESKNDHLINWSKQKGGLGIGNILRKNEALLGKWLWRFPLERNSLWCSIIESKYGLQNNGWNSNKVGRGSFCNPWKAISNGLDFFNTLIQYKVGRGDRTRVWEDTWLGTQTLESFFPHLYIVSCNKNFLISSLANWNSFNVLSWDLSFRRHLNGREEEFLNCCPL